MGSQNNADIALQLEKVRDKVPFSTSATMFCSA